MKIDDKDRDFEDADKLELNEDQQYAYSLITKARTGEHSKFRLVVDLDDFHDLRFSVAEARTSKRQFKKAARSLYKIYLQKLKEGIDDVYTLISARNCYDISSYWSDELDILLDIKDEFKTYMLMGHFLNIIMGKERPEEDMVDFRTLRGEQDDRSRE